MSADHVVGTTATDTGVAWRAIAAFNVVTTAGVEPA